MNYTQGKDLQSALQLSMCDPNANYFVTATFQVQKFNHKRRIQLSSTTHQSAKKTLKEWHARIDRKRLGNKWARKTKAADRMFFFPIPEHVNSNYHFHLMTTVPTRCDIFEAWAQAVWVQVARGGSLTFKKLETNDDRAERISYMTKDAWQLDQLENFVISTEFSSRH